MVLLFVLIARWYWSPRLAPLPLPDALTPLLLLHLTRVLGLTMLVPGVIDPDLPRISPPQPPTATSLLRCWPCQPSRRCG